MIIRHHWNLPEFLAGCEISWYFSINPSLWSHFTGVKENWWQQCLLPLPSPFISPHSLPTARAGRAAGAAAATTSVASQGLTLALSAVTVTCWGWKCEGRHISWSPEAPCTTGSHTTPGQHSTPGLHHASPLTWDFMSWEGPAANYEWASPSWHEQ